MGEHTPTPWAICAVRTVANTAMIVGGEAFHFGLIADVTDDKDAAFILKAANYYDALMIALRRIASLDEKNVTKYAQGIAREALAKVQP